MLIPITALSSGARLLGEGKFGHRIEVKTADELEELAGQFNSMFWNGSTAIDGLVGSVKVSLAVTDGGSDSSGSLLAIRTPYARIG